ncbi:putative drug exporter of the RND superfamily [Seinonella peptonophila]|uniref:Putative drug exporter of the RND superfamily n=1 Tax=Seinonella peptonophila TaxID=112248 RepID=A0A1M4X6H3_9BACL|nr:MMPL family transporter [Seinonella peptonophila]SHE89046.1 putative drug exporter of the RND superfamily [Seinonella peptonophila]
MQWILRTKWIWAILWVVLAIGISATMPSLDQLVKEKGQPTVGETYKSGLAAKLQKELNKGKQGGSEFDAILVFHQERAFSKNDFKQVEQLLKEMKQKPSLHINSILTPFEHKEAEKRLLSKDRKTLMAIATVSKPKQYTIQEIHDQLKQEINRSKMDTYITGDKFIMEDYAQTSIDGVKKTELFTVIFIIAVLIFVFRSPIAPFISLIIVGISYLVSIGIVANLVEYFNFPFANTTQIFLVLVLFGIGTDYNILLFMRFKEELKQWDKISDAIHATYRTAGKTVFFSGLAVLIGFSMLSFSKFGIYQSGVAVAVGVVILLAVLFTIVPFCMAIFGEILFWPSKKSSEHKESRLWKWFGRFSVKRPILSIVIVIAITLPFFFVYQGKLSFDSLQEVHPNYESVKGFRLVAQSFGAGQTLPTTVLLKSDQALDSAEGLGFLDELQERLEQIPGVKLVYGPTRPNGQRIDKLYAKEQTKQVNKGLDQSNKGLQQISGGLNQAASQIQASTAGGFDNVNKLITGTDSIRQGLGQVGKVLGQIQTGLHQGAAGASQFSTSLNQLDHGIEQLTDSTEQILSGYRLLAKEMGKAESRMNQQIKAQSTALKQAAEQILTSVKEMERKNPELAQSEELATIRATAEKLKEQAAHPTAGASFSQVVEQMNRANQGLAAVVAGEKKLQSGSSQLSSGAKQLANGLKQGATGQAAVTASIGKMDQGLLAVNQGQKQLNTGLKQYAAGMKELQQGLSKSSNGLNKISGGLVKGNQYLAELTGGSSIERFFVPNEVRKGDSFQKALDLYMSKDRKVIKYNIALSVDPYSPKAMDLAKEIDKTVKEFATYTPYKNLQIGTGGVSASNDDLQHISAGDFSRTVNFMLIGIGIMLILLFRSFWLPVFVMLSLVGSYYTALSFSELVFSHWFGGLGLSWTVPFFSFILIIALGVDYSIFLLMRYQESIRESASAAILLAMRKIGGVVISAAIILCGTFAAMYPAGVTTLVQISTVVILALLLLAFVLLPLFIPAGIALMEKQSLREQQHRKQIEQDAYL